MKANGERGLSAWCLLSSSSPAQRYDDRDRTSVPTDPATLCPIDRSPAELVVLLLDASDELTQAQRLQVSNELMKLQGEVGKLGLIDVYTIDGASRNVIKPVLELCNPGDGSDLNRFYENPSIAKKRWQSFSRRLSGEVDRLVAAKGTETSPIMEAIQATASRTFALPSRPGCPAPLHRIGLATKRSWQSQLLRRHSAIRLLPKDLLLQLGQS